MLLLLVLTILGFTAGYSLDVDDDNYQMELIQFNEYQSTVNFCKVDYKICKVQNLMPIYCQQHLETCTLTARSYYCSISDECNEEIINDN